MAANSVWQMVKFTLFSISAGLIQVGSFAIFEELFKWSYWPSYLISLILSVLWNFTLNRRYTFKSAANIPIAMLKVAGFYLVFTPLSTFFVNWAEGFMPSLIPSLLSMLANFILEFMVCKFLIYNNKSGDKPPLCFCKLYFCKCFIN